MAYEQLQEAPPRSRRATLGGPANAALPAATTYGNAPEQGDIFASVRTPDTFHNHRWRCIAHPDRARETLGPWAKVELNILSARDLVAQEASVFVDPVTDAFVKVYIDDQFVYETPTNYSLNPKWHHSGFLNVLAPNSMMRLQVADKACKKGQEGIGFVELCIGELPMDKMVEGLLELRFMENFQLSSTARYAFHCKTREDAMTPANTVGAFPQKGSANGSASPRELTKEVSTENLGFYMSKKARGHSMLGACCQGHSGSNLPSRPEHHLNAGEIYVQMTLTRIGDTVDELFALALEAPPPHFVAAFVVEDNAPSLKAQSLWDDTQYVKFAVYDDFLMCAFNWVTYILYWRCFAASLVLTVVFALTCIWTWLFLATVPFLVAAALLLNSNDTIRNEMIISGANAPLTQHGFDKVARMMSSAQMEKFLKRVIERFEGTVVQEEIQTFRSVAARCFRDGVPTLSYSQLVDKLQCAPWIKIAHKPLAVDQLVFVDERHGATITDLRGAGGGETVDVKYDDPVLRQQGGTGLPRSRVTPRAGVPNIPGYLIPARVDGQLRNYHLALERVKMKLLPLLHVLSDIVTWRNQRAALPLTLFLLALSGFGIFLCFKEETDTADDTAMGKIIQTIVVSLDNAAVMVIGLIVLVGNADWFVAIRSICKICKRRCTMKRRAPEGWAFFRPVKNEVHG